MIRRRADESNSSPTVQAALKDAVARLQSAGVDDPLRDARVLMRDALGVSAGAFAATPGAQTLSDAEAARFGAFVAAREARRPVSQILGRRAFYGRVFRVTSDVLDPRPESETVVEAALAAIAPEATARVLDLGVGSGCLLLSVLAERPAARGLGVDVSAAALAVAAENAAALGLSNRTAFRVGDWTDGLEGRFDVVICNPPYIGAAEWETLAPEVRDWEPRGALTPGPDALAVYRALAPRLSAVLREAGVAVFEVGRGQADDVAALLRAAGLDIDVACDLGGVPRIVRARRSPPCDGPAHGR